VRGWGRRLAVAALVLVLVAAGLGWWRLVGQRVDLVIVNDSPWPVEVVLQSSPFGPSGTATTPSCASSSTDLARGQAWSLSVNGQPYVDDTMISVPFTARMVAVMVRVDRTGTVTLADPVEVGAPVDAPASSCSGVASGG
jgi:hypothetical protein